MRFPSLGHGFDPRSPLHSEILNTSANSAYLQANGAFARHLPSVRNSPIQSRAAVQTLPKNLPAAIDWLWRVPAYRRWFVQRRLRAGAR